MCPSQSTVHAQIYIHYGRLLTAVSFGNSTGSWSPPLESSNRVPSLGSSTNGLGCVERFIIILGKVIVFIMVGGFGFFKRWLVLAVRALTRWYRWYQGLHHDPARGLVTNLSTGTRKTRPVSRTWLLHESIESFLNIIPSHHASWRYIFPKTGFSSANRW